MGLWDNLDQLPNAGLFSSGKDDKAVKNALVQSQNDYQSQRLAGYRGGRARGEQMGATFSPLGNFLGSVYGQENVPQIEALLAMDPQKAYGTTPGASNIHGIGTPEEDYSKLKEWEQHQADMHRARLTANTTELPDWAKASQPDWYWESIGVEKPKVSAEAEKLYPNRMPGWQH